MRARLDDLIRQGVTHVATFVPWQLVESDISHQLTRFLQLISDRKMTVSLIVTPEVGVHYPNSGLPKDVISRKDNLAQHFHGAPVSANLAPNGVGLPSYFAPEFQKRYYSYLSRIDSYFADVSRQQPDLLKGVSLVMTGGFWKYYRSPRASCQSPFAGPAGDYSGAAALAYRHRVDQFYSQREFADPTPSAANRWKTRNMEDVNRRWFYQQSEDVSRARMAQHLRKKSSFMPVSEIELHTPEADPSLFYSQFMQQLSGGSADFSRLSLMLDESVARGAMGSEGPAAPSVHWSSLGGFHSLADSEKQFLILKSLLLVGGQGGGIYIDAGEWFSLSTSFRTRTEALARSVAHRDLRVKNRAIYLAPHLWSSAGTLWEELLRKVGPGARLVSSMDLVLRERNARLVVVDPHFAFTRDAVIRLTSWVKSGRVVVMPRSSLYTEAARAELEAVTADTKRIEIDLGMPYRLHSIGDGKLIIYDLPEGAAVRGESLSAWQTFLTAILSVAEVQGYCRLSDSRLSVIPLERRGGGLGLFVLNGTRRNVSGDIIFPGDVAVSDLTVALSISGPQKGSAPSNRFSLEVPPCGIFPLAVDGIGMQEEHERGMASDLTEKTAEGALDAAIGELPGFNPNETGEALWN